MKYIEMYKSRNRLLTKYYILLRTLVFSVYRFSDNHGIKLRLLSKQKSAGFLEMASK